MTNKTINSNIKNFTEVKKAEKFDIIQAVILEALGLEKSVDIVDFLQAESDRLNKANSKKKGVKSKTTVQKEEDMTELLEWFKTVNPEVAYNGAEIVEALGKDWTPQKTTSRLSAMAKNGTLERVEKSTNDTKKVGYKLATTQNAEE